MIDEFASISSLGSVMGGYFADPEVSAKMTGTRRVGLAWHRANGDLERKHTCGLYVTKPRRANEPPVLVVYVDSRMRAVDFSANKDIYLARMAAEGLTFSDIRFEQDKLGRKPGQRTPAGETAPKKPERLDLPPLTAAEEEQVRKACEGLSPKLAQSAYKAMSNSLRREKAK